MGDDIPGSEPPWFDVAIQSDGPLTADIETDVCIIGAGVSGINVAHELTRRGHRIVVLDRGEIGHGESGNTTAHLVTALDERYFRMEKSLGAEKARGAAEGHSAAIDRIERIVHEEKIDCGFQRVPGYLFVDEPMAEQTEELIERERAAAGRAGIVSERLERAPLDGIEPGPCLRFPGQAQYHPLAYLAGLTRSIRAGGGRIFTGTSVNMVQSGAAPEVHAALGQRVRAKAVLVAANGESRRLVSPLVKLEAVRSHVIALRIGAGSIEKALWWDGYWDDDSPYHYVRLARGADEGVDELIVGGEDRAADGVEDSTAHDRLAAWAQRRFPAAGAVTRQWNGTLFEPRGELAVIGRAPARENVFVVCGDSGNGMTYAAIAAMIIPDLIEGTSHPWERLYKAGGRSRSSG